MNWSEPIDNERLVHVPVENIPAVGCAGILAYNKELLISGRANRGSRNVELKARGLKQRADFAHLIC